MHLLDALTPELLGQAFPPGPWQGLLVAFGAATALALGLSVVERIPARGPRRAASELPDLGAGTAHAVVLEVRDRVKACVTADRVDAVRIVDELVRGAVAVEASDAHLSPTPTGLTLTYRVHGVLHTIATLPSSATEPVANRIKVLARLDIQYRATPQDGRLVTTVGRRAVEARVSTLPTESGERIVLRLVRGGRSVPELESLGFSEEVLTGLTGLLNRPQGLVFVTGPVGSGKTTTLYAALEYITRSRGTTTALVTLEDPIELELPFATQTQMHARAGMTFASTLRSVLRQDPNVLMLGEIRDAETADIAMQAGLTGHLILTTVHADRAVGPFPRLIDMHIEPFLLASGTAGSLSQRLVRSLCLACRRAGPPSPADRERFAHHGLRLLDEPFYEPVGCELCEGQGYTGRFPIAELIVLDAETRQAIHAARPIDELTALAVERGMTPLLMDGLRRAREGDTSLAEVLRVAG